MGMNEDHSADLIEAFKAQEERKRLLFLGAGLFVILDAVAFLVLLACAFYLVARHPAAWHLFLAPALAGGLGALISIFMLKAIYGMGAPGNGKELLPSYETMKEVGQDMSQ